MRRCARLFLGALALVALLATGALAQTPEEAPPPADVVISPGDVLNLTVVGQPEMTRRLTVTADGTIPVALVGEVKVAGLKPGAAAEAIRKALSRYLREPVVTIDLVEANRASIYGQVARPGVYVLPPSARVMDLVQMAGGFSAAADRANLQLLRKGQTVAVDLSRFSAAGDPAMNPELRAGDALTVPERVTLTISVLGQVMRPGTFTSPVDSRLMDAVQMAGGFSERADRKRVSVLRGGGQFVANLEEFLSRGDGEQNLSLQTNDVITVPEKRMLAISVLGQVLKPSVYQVPEGTTVAEAITLAGGLVEGADVSLAKLMRRDAQGDPGEGLDLRAALESGSAAANIALQDGDVISIPRPVVERRFGVLGAVRAGGYFLMERDQVTITEALSRAGGPVPDANLQKTYVIRRSGDQVTRTLIDLRAVLQGKSTTQPVDVTTLGAGDVLYLDTKKEPFVNRSTVFSIIGVMTSLLYLLRR